MAKGKFKKKFSRGGGGFGSMKSMLAPVVGGALDRVIDQYSPVDGIGGVIAGMFLKSGTTRDIGLYKAGYSVAGMLPIPGLTSGGTQTGGFN